MRTTWFAVDRGIQDHWLWKDKPFARGQAWIDLLLMARYADGKDYYNGHMVERQKGTVYCSDAFLAERWGWSRGKVRRFINELETDRMCSRNGTADGTALTIENWGVYQDARSADGTTDGTAHGTTDGTADGTQKYKDTKIYKENNVLYSLRDDARRHVSNEEAGRRLDEMRAKIRRVNEGRSK